MKDVAQRGLPSDILTLCKRELIQAVMRTPFNGEEYKSAVVDGFVVKCGDGVTRRLYPMLFAYSADYPEKYVNKYTATRYMADYSIQNTDIWGSTIGNTSLCSLSS